uniref:Homologous recombination OB-fold protein OB-fold domain-containing protein n=1 Tax=Tanacetum cinerariifolium TaxID=118510 RepID=A0A6L2LMI6_TANCI|nr:hypothetical protein [Tanacetum cinerariifolium]
MGLEVGLIRRIQGIGYGVLEFLGVGTTFDIFQNIYILYLEYGILIFSGYGVLSFFPSWSLASYKSDEMVIEAFFGSCFFFFPLDYLGGQILDLRLPRSTMMSYKEMTDLLLDKTKDDIWKWFYCKPKCKLEKGLTLVENDRDYEKMFELANFHGYLDVYVGHNPQVILIDWYFKNVEVVCESDEEVTSKYKSHEKAKKYSSTMSLEELIAWEQEETQSPSYLRSPHVWKITSASTRKGKVVLDDFKDVANGKRRVVLDDFADMVNGKENHEWEYFLDIDDSNLLLSALLRLSNSSNTSLLQTQEMYVDEKATRIIPGPAGIFQTDRIHKLNNFNDALIQEYIRKLIDDVSETDDFKRRLWIMALEFIYENGEIGGGCFGDIKSYLKKRKLEIVVAIITCTPNVLGDINVTVKDPLGIMSGTINYKVLLDDGYDKAIKVGSALILQNVSVFCDKSSNYYLNITTKNLVKIFQKYTVVEDADGASCSNI